jgi:hypothetical protein
MQSMKSQLLLRRTAATAFNGLYPSPALYRRFCYLLEPCCHFPPPVKPTHRLRTSCFYSGPTIKTLPVCKVHSIHTSHKKRKASPTETSTVDAVTISPPPEQEDPDAAHIGISDVEYVASYNWLERPTPTIMVPGIPPVWQLPEEPPRLTPDSKKRIHFIDENADRNPSSPLEPLIRAVQTTYPDFDYDNLDVVADRWPIRQLLQFAAGKPEHFQFGLEIVGNIAFFTRIHERTRNIIPSGMFKGYHRTFERLYTKMPRSAQDSTSHHRIIRYRLGAFRCLVRTSFDAYLQEEVPGRKKPDNRHIKDQADLVNFMSSVSPMPKPPSTEDTPEIPELKVIPGGKEIDHAALLQLSTQSISAKRPKNVQVKFPDLWLSQTPNYVVAIYENAGERVSRLGRKLPPFAKFKDVRVKHVKEDVQKWERDNQTTLRKFVTVLNQILEKARALKTPCIVRGSSAEETITISRVLANSRRFGGLPEDFHAKLSTKN